MMHQALPRCSTSFTLIRVFQSCSLRRSYSPMFSETTLTEIPKPKDHKLEKKKDSTMLEVLFAYQNIRQHALKVKKELSL